MTRGLWQVLHVSRPDPEIGFPRGPNPFDEAQQAAYWKAVFNDPVARQVNLCIFDGMANTPWKNETLDLPGGVRPNVGPYWSVLFGPQRHPYPNAKEILTLWKTSRD